jgi:uncharacterized membrane protein SirB2
MEWSSPVAIAGIVLLIIGIALLIWYLVSYFSTYKDTTKPSWLVWLLVASIVLIIVGIVMLVYVAMQPEVVKKTVTYVKQD